MSCLLIVEVDVVVGKGSTCWRLLPGHTGLVQTFEAGFHD